MSSTPTAPKPASSAKSQPAVWAHYAAAGAIPISFTASVLIHIAFLALVAAVAFLSLVGRGESNKPPEMNIVEIEGGGGGLGGNVVGPGDRDKGSGNRTEVGQVAKANQQPGGPVKINDFKFKPLEPQDLLVMEQQLEATKDRDPFAVLDVQQEWGKKFLDQPFVDPNAKPGPAGSGNGKGGVGNAGGPKGPGLGNKDGPGKGTSPVGSVLTDQRRRELRWKILASEDGDVHLKKLRALKVLLVIPHPTQPGMVLRYDLAQPTIKAEVAKAVDDSNKVRWKNNNRNEMVGLAKVLGLQAVPPYAVIYLPSNLERDMAQRELAHAGRQENEIELTVWDLHVRDGSYDNEPQIIQQVMRPGVR